MELFDYEIRNNAYLRENGAECAVLLKRDGRFPLSAPGLIALYGNGARHTRKGGTGSGEVNSRFYITAEEGLKRAGFTIGSQTWLDAYDQVIAEAEEQFIADIKAEARAKHTQAAILGMGRVMPEPDYSLPLSAPGDTAVYVLSRICGEGSDRAAAAGDLLLTPSERRDILACRERYTNFMLVLNVGGPVDLSEVAEVGNILLLSQLGVETGDILADILLGRSTPSGRLTTSWADWGEYPSLGSFGERDETRYEEGVYLGYRYFDSVGKRARFPFGFGLSYTDFSFDRIRAELDEETVTVRSSVKNTGAFPGKDVLQLYVSVPEGRLDQPFQTLAAFSKTSLLAPQEEQELSLRFALSDLASYDTLTASYLLEPGDYVLRLGHDSTDTLPVALIRVENEIKVAQAKNILPTPPFTDFHPADRAPSVLSEDLPVLVLDSESIRTKVFDYASHAEIAPEVRALPDDQLVKLNIGAFGKGGFLSSIIGDSGYSVAGSAGQTSIEAETFSIPSLVMADGPAGLRLARRFVKNEKGVHSLGGSMIVSMQRFLPKIAVAILKAQEYKPRKGDVVREQYATAIPIGTAIAQSFNLDFAERCGDLVGGEMERFGVHLWLAPALNIHRSILCGRNFEYYSEDPLVSGEFAAAVTRGVQRHPGCGTTIKHYAANNQERNRTQNSSVMSERTLREIYLRGFKICVQKSQPKAVMTSYNLLNGVHTSEHRGLISDVLRGEFGFRGIVMTDWVIFGYPGEKGSVHPIAQAPRVLMAGGDLFMPGSRHDYNQVRRALKARTVSREQLQINATRVLRMARELTGGER